MTICHFEPQGEILHSAREVIAFCSIRFRTNLRVTTSPRNSSTPSNAIDGCSRGSGHVW